MKMQLRVYMGAAVYNPDNVIILPDIMPNGVVSGGGKGGSDLVKVDNVNFELGKPQHIAEMYHNDNTAKAAMTEIRNQISDYPATKTETGLDAAGQKLPLILYPGRLDEKVGDKWVTIQENSGHLGCLDHPEADRLHGLYKYNPDVRVRSSQ